MDKDKEVRTKEEVTEKQERVREYVKQVSDMDIDENGKWRKK